MRQHGAEEHQGKHRGRVGAGGKVFACVYGTVRVRFRCKLTLSLSSRRRCGFIGRVAEGLAQVWRKAPRSMDRSRDGPHVHRGQWSASLVVQKRPSSATTQKLQRCHSLFSEVVIKTGGGGRTWAFRTIAIHAPPRQPGRHVVLQRSQLVFLRHSAAARGAR